MKTVKILTRNEQLELTSLFDKIEELHKESDADKREKMIDELYLHSNRLRQTVELNMVEGIKNYDLMGNLRTMFGK